MSAMTADNPRRSITRTTTRDGQPYHVLACGHQVPVEQPEQVRTQRTCPGCGDRLRQIEADLGCDLRTAIFKALGFVATEVSAVYTEQLSGMTLAGSRHAVRYAMWRVGLEPDARTQTAGVGTGARRVIENRVDKALRAANIPIIQGSTAA